MDNLDKETKEILSDEKKIEHLCEHEGWEIVRNKLIEKIQDLQHIQNVDITSPENAIIDLKARGMAVQILWEWLTVDVQGTAQNSKSNPMNVKMSQYIFRMEE